MFLHRDSLLSTLLQSVLLKDSLIIHIPGAVNSTKMGKGQHLNLKIDVDGWMFIIITRAADDLAA